MIVVDLAGTSRAWNFGGLKDALGLLGIQPTHVLHVGAHLGQELRHYRAAGIKRVTLVEPTPASAAALRAMAYPGVTVLEVACGNREARVRLNLCGGDGAWNTTREPGGDEVHGADGSVLVDMIPVRSIQDEVDMLVVDAQGTEVDVLASADLDGVKLVVVETQSTGHPDAASFDDVTAHMASRGFTPALLWNHEFPGSPYHGFADVFYVR